MGSVGSNSEAFNSASFQNNMDSYIGGGYGISELFSKAELNYIKNNMEITSKPLYRTEDNDWTAKNLKVGDTVNFNDALKSFTRESESVSNLLNDADEMGLYNTPVVFKTSGSVSHFNVSSYGTGVFDYQKESFVSGKGWVISNISTQTFGGRRVKVVTIKRKK